jgi:hypothetical protein
VSLSFGVRSIRMKKGMPQDIAEEAGELSPEFRRELNRRMADVDNPVRYVVFSDIIGNGRWRLWLDVSGDGYGTSIDQATLFKREYVARAVAKAYSEGRKSALLIAKITTKNNKRRVLKFEKRKHRTDVSRRRLKRYG